MIRDIHKFIKQIENKTKNLAIKFGNFLSNLLLMNLILPILVIIEF